MRTFLRAGGLLLLGLGAVGCSTIRISQIGAGTQPAPEGRAPVVALLRLDNKGPEPYFVETLALGAVYGSGPEMERLFLRQLAKEFRAAGWTVLDERQVTSAVAKARHASGGRFDRAAICAAGAALGADRLVNGNFHSSGRSILTFGGRTTDLELWFFNGATGATDRVLHLRQHNRFFLLMNFRTNDQIADELARAAVQHLRPKTP